MHTLIRRQCLMPFDFHQRKRCKLPLLLTTYYSVLLACISRSCLPTSVDQPSQLPMIRLQTRTSFAQIVIYPFRSSRTEPFLLIGPEPTPTKVGTRFFLSVQNDEEVWQKRRVPHPLAHLSIWEVSVSPEGMLLLLLATAAASRPVGPSAS